MKKKLISIILAVCICRTAFLTPAYADETTESEPVVTMAVSSEIVTQPPVVITLPPPDTQPLETTTSVGFGVIETPRGAGNLLEDAAQTKLETIDNIILAIPDFTEREFVMLAERVIDKLDMITEPEFMEHNFSDQFSDDYDE
jgi:hypothetical protein